MITPDTMGKVTALMKIRAETTQGRIATHMGLVQVVTRLPNRDRITKGTAARREVTWPPNRGEVTISHGVTMLHKGRVTTYRGRVAMSMGLMLAAT